MEYKFPISQGRSVRLSGRADRIDKLNDGILQIIDYKSGNVPHLEFTGINNLFNGAANERVSNIFQTLLYSMMLHKSKGVESVPTLYFASKMMGKSYSPNIVDVSNPKSRKPVERYSAIAADFEHELTSVLEELFDYDKPFVRCDDADTCKNCDFKTICRR